MLKKIIVVTFLLVGSLLSVAGASTSEKDKSVIAILTVNNSELEDSGYINEYAIDRLSTKFQGQATILTGTELVEKIKSKGITDLQNTDDVKLTDALKELGVTNLVRAEIGKIEVKRGIKMGLMIKKWCSADVPATITVTDITKDVSLYNKTIAEKGKNEVSLGFASSSGAIKIALGKVFEQFDAEFRLP